jgi:hypothetical protein
MKLKFFKNLMLMLRVMIKRFYLLLVTFKHIINRSKIILKYRIHYF